MKESVAKTKLCPFFGPATLIASSCSTKSVTEEQAKIIGAATLCQTTACMAWYRTRNTHNEGYCALIEESS